MRGDAPRCCGMLGPAWITRRVEIYPSSQSLQYYVRDAAVTELIHLAGYCVHMVATIDRKKAQLFVVPPPPPQVPAGAVAADPVIGVLVRRVLVFRSADESTMFALQAALIAAGAVHRLRRPTCAT